MAANKTRIVALMASALDRTRHDQAVATLWYRTTQAGTLDCLCDVLGFRATEKAAILALEVDLATWRALPQGRVERALDGIDELSVGAKLRFYHALYGEAEQLSRLGTARSELHRVREEQAATTSNTDEFAAHLPAMLTRVTRLHDQLKKTCPRNRRAGRLYYPTPV